MTVRSLDPRGVIDLLERARKPDPFALAFDADGTLWSGDVGEDTFDHATSRGFLGEVARPSLAHVANTHGLSSDGTASEIGARIFAAYRRGTVDERLTCEVLTWAYAGHTEAELAGIAGAAFDARGLRDRTRSILRPIWEWARAEKGFVMVVSASPRVVIETALAHAGIRADAVVAGMAAVEEGRIAPRMASPVPYGPEKRAQGERLLRERGVADWLASFGDNVFDTEMLRAAHVGVAVCPKPALAERLTEIPNAVVLC